MYVEKNQNPTPSPLRSLRPLRFVFFQLFPRLTQRGGWPCFGASFARARKQDNRRGKKVDS